MTLTFGKYLKEKTLANYLIKFGISFFVLYFIILVFKALANPIGYYSPFFDKYIDLVSWFRSFLLGATQFFVGLFGYSTNLLGDDVLKLSSGGGVRLMFPCMGFQIMCIWAGFVIANEVALRTSLRWIFLGVVVITLINIVRLGMILISIKGQWGTTFNVGNHGWFNFFSYFFILVLMVAFDKTMRKRRTQIENLT